MDMKVYFDSVRKSVFGGTMNQDQVSGQEKIIQYRDEHYPNVDDDQLSYMLATAYWETAHTMQPIKEMGGLSYLKSKPYYPFYGRGLIQLTWDFNYKHYKIENTPEKALEWGTALYVMFDGMLNGIFTGKKISDYVSDGKRDYVNARRVINGTDKANEIASIAIKFRSALLSAEPPAKSDPQPQIDPQFKSNLLSLLNSDKDVQEAVLRIVKDANSID